MRKKTIFIFLTLLFFSIPAWSISFNGDSSSNSKPSQGNNTRNSQSQSQTVTGQKTQNENVIKIDSNQKLDVIDVKFFFSYSCVECYYWYKELEKIEPKLAQAQIEFNMQPIIYDEASDKSTQLFYALQETNQMSLHKKIWQGLANNDWSTNSLNSLESYINDIGGNGKKIVEAIKNNITVQNKTYFTPRYTRQFGIKWPPAIVVSGRYGISKAILNKPENLPEAVQAALNYAASDIKAEIKN